MAFGKKTIFMCFSVVVFDFAHAPLNERTHEMVVGFIKHAPEAMGGGHELSAYEHSEAGLISGVATRALIHPLDLLKIRFQLQEEPLRGARRGKYTGIAHAIGVIWREEGALAFWKVVSL